MTESNKANFYNKTRGARKIIVVDLGFLGDSVHLIPALWDLKQAYPQAELQVLTTPLGSEVLKMVPCVAKLWAFPLGPQSPPWWKNLGMVASIRKERCDLAINFSGADRTLFMTAATGAQWRLGQEPNRRHFWSKWLIRDWVPRQDRALPVYEQRRQVLSAAGIPLAAASRLELFPPDKALEWARSQVVGEAVHISVNASTFMKEWSLDSWVKLIALLTAANLNLTILATAGPSYREQQRLGELASRASSPRLRTFSESLSVAQLAALVSRCAVHVGCDSGVLHLALGLNVPTVALFRNYAGLEEWRPRGEKHRAVIVDCPCADAAVQPCRQTERAACLASIQPQQVAEEILRTLSGRK